MEFQQRMETRFLLWAERWVWPIVACLLRWRLLAMSLGFRLTEWTRVRNREEVIKLACREYRRADRFGRRHYKKVYEVSLFVAMLDADIAAVHYNLLREDDEWRRRFQTS